MTMTDELRELDHRFFWLANEARKLGQPIASLERAHAAEIVAVVWRHRVLRLAAVTPPRSF